LVLAVLLVTSVAHAQAPLRSNDDEIVERLHFIQERLKAETVQARAWEAGWSVVDVGGLGYSAYQISQSGNRAQLTEGIVGAVKSIGGVARIALAPLKTGRGVGELDGVPDGTPDERLRRVVLAEALLRRNAHEADLRFSWKPHIISLLINLAGGIAVWIAGDFWRGLQSAGIGFAVGEVQIWTAPWQARRDLREYRQQFGGFASDSAPRPSSVAARPSVSVSAGGVRLSF
jgi:hypothetical protein